MWTGIALDRQRVLIAILISVCALIAVPTHGSQAITAASQSPINLGNQDQAEIVKAVMEDAIAHPLTSFNLLWTELVSSENLSVENLPEVSGHKFRLLDLDKIEEMADRSGSMSYLVFNRFRAKDGKVNVEVCRVTIGTCFGWFSSSSCFNGDFREESGSWTGELRPSLAKKVVRPTPLRQRVRQQSSAPTNFAPGSARFSSITPRY